MLDTVKITYDNGLTVYSDFNSEVVREEIARYYMNNIFNLGHDKDEMHRVIKVEFPN